jgi:hypothetical protein
MSSSFLISQNIPPSRLKSLHQKLQIDLSTDEMDPSIIPEEITHTQLFSAEDILDSLHYVIWDTASNQWLLNTRTFYTTNENNEILSELSLEWDGAEWHNQTLYQYTYDTNNHMVTVQFQIWDGVNWGNDTQTVYTFDENDNQTSIVESTWDGTSWVNSLKQEYTYDNNQNLISRTLSRWIGAEWQGVFQHVFSYDANNKKILQVTSVWNSGWVLSQQVITSYDANNDPEIDLNQKWVVDHWEDYYRNIYDHDANHNRTFILRQTISDTGAVWVDKERFYYTFDSFNDILSQLYQTFENDEWINVYQFVLTYDEHLNRITELFQMWDSGWVNQDNYYYYYTLSTGSKNLDRDLSGITFFPNPATNSLNIVSLDALSQDVTVEIFSDSGVKVITTKINSMQNKSVDISKLIPGVYRVLINTERGMSIQSFVKM